MRGALIDFLCVVCEHLKLSVATTHTSVYLLDRFMDAHHISDNQLRLTVLTAVLLAGMWDISENVYYILLNVYYYS